MVRRLSLKPELLSFEGLLVLHVQLVAAFVIASVMNENARVAKATVAVLVVVLAPLGVVVNPRRHLHESRSLLRALQRP